MMDDDLVYLTAVPMVVYLDTMMVHHLAEMKASSTADCSDIQMVDMMVDDSADY
jgi:hypothetical protein